MSDLERHLTLENAEVGMRLARALHDASGQLVMTQGCELSQANISVLKRRAVRELWVLDAEPPAPHVAAQTHALRQWHQARLVKLFRLADARPEERHLQDLMRRHREIEPS